MCFGLLNITVMHNEDLELFEFVIEIHFTLCDVSYVRVSF